MYHQEAHELLIHLSDRRLLFNEMAIENPRYVEESVLVLRSEIRSLQARVNPSSSTTLSRALESIAASIRVFLDDAGNDIGSIVVTSGLNRFDRFCAALSVFRRTVAKAVEPLAIEEAILADWIEDALAG